jgi:hypothetical protein
VAPPPFNVHVDRIHFVVSVRNCDEHCETGSVLPLSMGLGSYTVIYTELWAVLKMGMAHLPIE